ncbi:MAG: TonB-dependent receptor [Chloracidobacterium sp.]|nr:TonB-dependent receptor [Chloracidobacterium sp.]
MFSSRFFALILTVVLFSAGLSAQQSASGTSLSIEVKDTNGAVVSGASLTLTGPKGAARNSVTDLTGKFSFEDLTEGEYRIKVEVPGFPTVLRNVTVTAGNANQSEIPLQLGAILESVTVTATRTQVTSEETAVPVSVIGREEIERKAINTTGDIFRTLPGSSTVNEGAFQVRPRIRGLDSNRVLILVDGERLNNSRTSTGQSGVEGGLVEVSQIESIEVARGSGSVLYGTDALGGTINIITRDTPSRRDSGFRFGGVLNTFYTSNENGRRGNIALTGAGKHVAFRVAQSLERFENYWTGTPDSEFLQDLRDQGVGITDDGEVLNSQSHAGNTQATLRFFLDDKKALRFNYERRRGADIGSAGLVGTFNAFFPFSNRDKINARYDAVALTRNLQRLSISGYYQTQFRNFTNVLTVPPAPPFFPGLYQFSETVTNTQTSGLDLQTDWTFGGRNSLTAGASFFRDENDDSRLVISASTPTSTTRRVSTTKSVPDASLENVAAFAQDEFRVTDRFKLVGGVRVDNFKTAAQPTIGFALPPLTAGQIEDLNIGSLASGINTTRTSVTGDFGGIFRLTNDISISSRIGRSFRTPNIFELFFTDRGSISNIYVVGNADLKPETGTNFDASVKIRRTHFSGSATYFRNSYKDFLNTVAATDRNGDFIFLSQPGPAVQVYQTRNVDRARIQGFEVEFEAPFKISLGYLTPNGNFSYLRGDDLDNNVPLDVISPFRTNIGVRWNNYGKSYFFDYYARIVAEQTRLSPTFLLPVNQGGNGGPEKGFTTHNVSGGYYFRRERHNFNINFGVSNIANRAYSEQFVFAPARGRAFTIGTTWEIR